ncbi:MAG TPA: histidine phosphatase family protein [Candidatus Binatia bacterium]|nr:histidine phosphatase family protein [Candidatus Binatia bacterium]
MIPKKGSGTIWPVLVTLTLAAILSDWNKATAQEAVFVVQNAESNLRRTELTDEGKRRAEALARMLKGAGIDVIYSFDRGYLVRTAEPTKKALNIKVNVLPIDLEAMDDLVQRLPTQHANQRVLIVAGPKGRNYILKGLGITDSEISTANAHNLFVIVPKERGEPLLIKMRW